MNRTRRGALLAAAAAVMLVGGIYLVFRQDAVLTLVGILLVIGSAIVFLVDTTDLLVLAERRAKE
ncbi:hypothetical protein [Halorussus halophilus]|uniref:hypothetical protein n=1 Tax=Halorussus halophilus TaxID=2650975 RepID=UPI0013012C27|nr:hypothetical protein [Halorussus halophilus]